MSFSPSTAVLIPFRAASFSSRARRAGPLPLREQTVYQERENGSFSNAQRRCPSDEEAGGGKEGRRRDNSPFKLTYSPILSATAPSSPFSSTISRRTSDQGDWRTRRNPRTRRVSFRRATRRVGWRERENAPCRACQQPRRWHGWKPREHRREGRYRPGSFGG